MVFGHGLCLCGCGQKTNRARQSNKRLGWVKDEPNRYVRGHATRKPDDLYRIEDRGYDTPCWVWQGHIAKTGYGKTRDVAAHRYYYQKYKGAIPEGYVVHHRCNNKPCVNPAHLEAVTPSQNALFREEEKRKRAENKQELQVVRDRPCEA
jgi:hypothetical protein